MSRYRSTLYIVGAIVLILVVGLLGRVPLQWRWLLMMVVFFGLLAAIGRDITGADKDVPMRSGRTEKRFVPGRLDGVLVDSRNKISLSRMQLIMWTVVVLSAWTTLAFHRVIPILQGRLVSSNTVLVREIAGLLADTEAASDEDVQRAGAVVELLTGAAVDDAGGASETLLYNPLDIAIPQGVLVALGISLTSLAGAGLIKTRQATNESGDAQKVLDGRIENASARAIDMNSSLENMKQSVQTLEVMTSDSLESLDASPEELAAANARLVVMEAELRAARAAAERANTRVAELAKAQDQAIGDLHANDSTADARWSDMLRGDTIANFRVTDLGKIQMLLLTVVLVLSYGWLIWSIMSMPQGANVLQVVPTISLPAFSESLNVLLAVSHGGYLATKTTL